jgi:hypothetical protein
MHYRRLPVLAVALALLAAASCRRPTAVPPPRILRPITADAITDETRREAMVSVYIHAADVVGDDLHVMDLDDAARLLAADVGIAAGERRRRAAIARLAATGVDEHHGALEILGAPIPEIVEALAPYPEVSDWFREAVVQNLLTHLWGPVTRQCLPSAPIWSVSRTANEVTVTVRLNVNRSARELGPVLDPQEWDRCSLFFRQAYVAKPDNQGQYPKGCGRDPKKKLRSPAPGTNWNSKRDGLLFEHFASLPAFGWFKNLLSITATPQYAIDQYAFRYELAASEHCLCSHATMSTEPGGIVTDRGSVKVDGAGGGWSLVKTVKVLEFAGRTYANADRMGDLAEALLPLMGVATQQAVCCPP